MDKNYYLFSSGTLEREDDSLRLNKETGEFERIPIETVDSLYCFGQITYNTKLVSILNEHTIEMHIFGWNNQYLGSHIPSKKVKSGETVVKQVNAYLTPPHRATIAREIIKGSIHNMLANLKYYNNRGRELSQEIQKLSKLKKEIPKTTDIQKLLGHEAESRKIYYSTFNKIITSTEIVFEKREYNPPSSEINALISFVNSLTYATVTSAIRQTALDPSIGYLHQPGDRRNTLALDLADIFKPILADRCLFRLVNRNQITVDDFKEGNYRLTDNARKTVISEYENILQDTIHHPDLERHTSFKYILRLEAYKLKKHLLNGNDYTAFTRWW